MNGWKSINYFRKALSYMFDRILITLLLLEEKKNVFLFISFTSWMRKFINLLLPNWTKDVAEVERTDYGSSSKNNIQGARIKQRLPINTTHSKTSSRTIMCDKQWTYQNDSRYYENVPNSGNQKMCTHCPSTILLLRVYY